VNQRRSRKKESLAQFLDLLKQNKFDSIELGGGSIPEGQQDVSVGIDLNDNVTKNKTTLFLPGVALSRSTLLKVSRYY
jgi:hypothetical protein